MQTAGSWQLRRRYLPQQQLLPARGITGTTSTTTYYMCSTLRKQASNMEDEGEAVVEEIELGRDWLHVGGKRKKEVWLLNLQFRKIKFKVGKCKEKKKVFFFIFSCPRSNLGRENFLPTWWRNIERQRWWIYFNWKYYGPESTSLSVYVGSFLRNFRFPLLAIV